jgi:hypothetical protein
VAEKQLTYRLVARDDASLVFKRVALAGEDSNNRITKSAEKSHKQLSLLTTAALGLGPAIVPIGAAAVAAGASLTGLGVAGVLAFQGIKKEMKDGTPIGQKYTATLGVLKNDLTTLERTAAGGVLTGFQKSVADLQPLMPVVNRDTALLSTKLGDIGSHVMPGLVSLFTTANPLFLQFAGDLDKGAQKFEAWTTSSDGARKFVQYAQENLPKVEDTLLKLSTAAGHIAQGFAPMGGVVLGELTAFSKVINAIPVPVLQVLAPALSTAVLAIKGLQVADAAAASLRGLALAETAAGAAAVDMTAALGPLAAVAVGVTVGVDLLKSKFPQLNDLLSNHTLPAVNENTAGMDALTTAYRNTHGQVEGSAAQLLAWGSTAQGAQTVTHDYAVTTGQLNTALTGLQTTVQASTQQTLLINDEFAVQANALGVTAGAYNTAKLAADQHTLSTAAATLQMQFENNAAGLLKQSLDALNDKNLSVAQATTTLDSATLSLTQSLHDNGRTVSENTAKGVANRQAIEQSVTAAQQQAQAVADSTGSTVKGTAAYKTNAAAILDRIAKQNGDITATQKANDKTYQYAKQLLGVAKIKVPPTKLDADTKKGTDAVTRYKQLIAGVKGKNVELTVTAKDNRLLTLLNLQQGANKRAAGSAFAFGGRVPGFGGGDIYPAMLEPGETVVPKHLTAAIAPWAMAMGLPGFAAGGLVNPRLNLNMTDTAIVQRLLNGVWLNYPTVSGGTAPAGLQRYALSLFNSHGWGADQLPPLVSLWNNESGWRWNARNPSSGAYGIPQALPASKMASAGPDWLTNPATQIRWGESYIDPVYGSPRNAWNAWLSRSPHWYDQGGWLPPGLSLAMNSTGRPERILSPRDSGTGTTVQATFNIYGATGQDEGKIAQQAVYQLQRWVEARERRAAKGARA